MRVARLYASHLLSGRPCPVGSGAISNIPRVDFIKIDVEGAELDVLAGASDTLKKFRPIVMMEFNSYAYIHLREISPRKALAEIFAIFDEIFYFKSTGQLIRLDKTESAREKFLHHNLFNGFVDDLLCTFRGAELVKPSIRSWELEHELLGRLPATIALMSAAIASKDTALQSVEASLQSTKEELEFTKQKFESTKQELESVYRSTSWRLTAPLRGLKMLRR